MKNIIYNNYKLNFNNISNDKSYKKVVFMHL